MPCMSTAVCDITNANVFSPGLLNHINLNKKSNTRAQEQERAGK